MPADPLFQAPRNSVWEPPGWRSGHDGRRLLVLVRLVWPQYVEVVPAHLLWVDGAAVKVEWQRGGTVRQSWLPKRDVRRSLRW
jgi:hypothetical protein